MEMLHWMCGNIRLDKLLGVDDLGMWREDL